MPRRHILVHALHRIGAGELAVLLVHVVCAGARVVAEPDAKVLLGDLEKGVTKHTPDGRITKIRNAKVRKPEYVPYIWLQGYAQYSRQ